MATTAALTENSRQGINFQISHCNGLEARLSPDLRPGCSHAYDETPVGLVVYVRNDPVNKIDPDGNTWHSVGPSDDPTIWWTPDPETPGMLGIGIGQNLKRAQAANQREEALAAAKRKLEQWNSLSESCQKGLAAALSVTADVGADSAAIQRISALNRSISATSTLKAATAGTSISWTMLAAIGIRESSGFYNTVQSGGWGRGVFHIDLEQQGWTSTPAQIEEMTKNAMNLSWAAQWAVDNLANNQRAISNAFPDLSGSDLQLALAASWNLGATGVVTNLSKGLSPDVGSVPAGQYGSIIVNLTDCFK